MNCQDITRLLDDGDIGSMTAKERGEVEAHLPACPDCAADWKIHQRLASGFAPPLPAGLMERARAVVVAGQASRRAPSRAIVYGTILVTLAAAAMLALWLREPAATTAAVEIAAPAQPAATLPVDVAPQVQAHAEQAAIPEPQPAPLPPGSFTVRVPPLKIEGNNATGNTLAQEFRDRLIARLGNVPGVVLVDLESSKASAAEYEVRISLTGGSSTLVTAQVDATTSAAFAASDAAVDAMAKMSPEDQARRRWELERAGTLRPAISAPPQPASLALLLGNGFPRPAVLNDSIAAARLMPGRDRVEWSAETAVRDLRTKVFPLNAALERELLAIVGDSSQKFAERRRALGGLLSIALRRGGLSAVDAAVVRAGAEFALTAVAGLDSDREALWDALALTGNPELVSYLIRGLDSAPTDTRLHFVRILASAFADDPRARAALEAASQQNSESVVRMAGVRESRDESKWNNYVVATLNNADLSDMQRLQPIADVVPDSAAFVAGMVRSKFQLDDKSVRELGVLIQRVVQNPDRSRFPQAEITMATNALKVLSTMDSPAARDVIVDVLRATDSRVSFLKTPVMSLAWQQFPNDPKVRAVLEEMASSTDPLARGFMAKSALQIMDSKASMEKLRQQQAQPQ